MKSILTGIGSGFIGAFTGAAACIIAKRFGVDDFVRGLIYSFVAFITAFLILASTWKKTE